MKLRLKGNSLRMRVTRSDLQKLRQDGRIEETTWLGPEENARLTYALEQNAHIARAALRFDLPAITVAIPAGEFERWAASAQVGVYATIDQGPRGSLEIIIEKDFACMHGSDAENLDAFPNPHAAG
jgi:hypothetical protein